VSKGCSGCNEPIQDAPYCAACVSHLIESQKRYRNEVVVLLQVLALRHIDEPAKKSVESWLLKAWGDIRLWGAFTEVGLFYEGLTNALAHLGLLTQEEGIEWRRKMHYLCPGHEDGIVPVEICYYCTNPLGFKKGIDAVIERIEGDREGA